MFKRLSRARPVIWAIITLIASGCVLKDVPEVPVAKQWAQAMHNFSMIPIYPMRENVYVGDIRLTVNPNSVDNFILPYRNIGQLPISEAVHAFYDRRISFPADKGFMKGENPTQPWDQPTSSNSVYDPIDSDPQNTNRLRLAALPGHKVATVAEASIGSRLPLGSGGHLGSGAAGRAGRVFEISLTGIEEVEVPSDFLIVSAFDVYCNENRKTIMSPASLEFSLAQLIPRAQWNDSVSIENARPQLAVITRVLYARAVDYTFRTDASFAADLAAIVGPLADLQALSQSIDALAETPSDASLTEPTDSSATSVANQLAGLVTSLRGTLSSSSSPGIAVSTVVVDARGVTLRDVYVRPMAFAAQAAGWDASPSQLKEICSAPAAPIIDRWLQFGQTENRV